MLDGGAVICCDLDRKVDGVSVVIGLAFREDLDEDPETPPCEWLLLPNVGPELLAPLEKGESVTLIEETTGQSYPLRLSADELGMAI